MKTKSEAGFVNALHYIRDHYHVWTTYLPLVHHCKAFRKFTYFDTRHIGTIRLVPGCGLPFDRGGNACQEI